MTLNARRLRRLVRAQLDMCELLESKLRAERSRLEMLKDARSGVIATLDRASMEGLAYYSAALRRLAELDNALCRHESTAASLQTRLLQARVRHDALARRAAVQGDELARKEQEDNTLESVLLAATRATGKSGVVN